ncbi:hypothetical protein VNO78_24761 [Psophocarpus tetragonolobus]|uniref:Uncharacterized protein n=1 Tax=Psophocarpus tetragonolobus TaxID=3891 RepID=A0AAN9XEI6_PSOTE
MTWSMKVVAGSMGMPWFRGSCFICWSIKNCIQISREKEAGGRGIENHWNNILGTNNGVRAFKLPNPMY